ncbi:MAG TPA: CaiB/BaiF CoA-transferase family protein [Hyphomicrobiaceae bacterium]|nr:CaiB/BaiF CoA-transferase family protein [Hyphomicrobiaceae bacterium]
MPGPLSGIRVVDLTRILAGPSCTQILGDLGADVIKIEMPGSGDDTRRWGPPFLKDDKGEPTRESAYFSCANRNKRSITINLSDPEGQKLIQRLAAKSDVLVENFKFGGLSKYGLAYDDLKTTNPGLVYCSITGFGHTGPYAPRPGYDVLMQAMGGLMSVTGAADGEPQKCGVPISDLMAGMYAAVGICAALRSREVTGKGQAVDIGMLDTTVAMMANQALNYLASGEVPPRLGNEHPNIAPYQVFPTADGSIIIACGSEQQYQRFCKLIERPDLIEDPRFHNNENRLANRRALVDVLNPILSSKPSAHWLAELEAASISCGPINTLDQTFADPQVAARGMKIEMPHPATGTRPVTLVGSPLKLSDTGVEYRHSPPLLGEHTGDVLHEVLGLDADAITALKAAGTI